MRASRWRHVGQARAGETPRSALAALRELACLRHSSPPHEADEDTSACERWRLAACLLLGRCRGERTRVAHVVPGGLDPAIGALDVRDAELVDMAVERIGDAADVAADAKRSMGSVSLPHQADDHAGAGRGGR